MRMMHLLWLIPCGLAWSAPAAFPGTPGAPIDGTPVAELVSRLGSAKFKEREAATLALETIGGPALEALQRAVQSNDPEIVRRAQNLARLIRKRNETAQFLAPLRLHLVYKDVPVLQAVEDFARKSQFPIEIVSPKAALTRRKITLDTGLTTFWDAFAQFCEKAGLVERLVTSELDLQGPTVWAGGRGGRGRNIVQIVEPSAHPVRAWDGRLTLVDGRPPRLPTALVGSVRIRALSANTLAGTLGGEGALFVLEATPQPRSAWHQAVDLRIDRALDENGQDLAGLVEHKEEGNSLSATVNTAALLDAGGGRPLIGLRNLPVRLQAGVRPPSQLTEVHGVLSAEVQTPPQPLLTVDSILKCEGRTFLGEDGETLKIVEVQQAGKNELQIRAELNDGSLNVLWGMRGGILRPRFLLPGGGRRGGMSMESPTAMDFELRDADDRRFPLHGRDENPVVNGNTLTRELILTYQLRPGLGAPQKLICSGRRTLIIEVPFTLRDIPVP